MKELFLPCGRIAIISDIDRARCQRYSWHVNEHNSSGKPYVCATVTIEGRRTTIYLHRFITNCPPTRKADHKDRDTLNNRRSNLRIASFRQNNANRKFWTETGYKGVSKDRGVFRARIRLDGEQVQLGQFVDPVLAAKAYDAAAFTAYGEFAYLNFPDDYPHTPDDEPEFEIPF